MKLTILFLIVLPLAIFAQPPPPPGLDGEEDSMITSKSVFTVVTPNTIRQGRRIKIEISIRWIPPKITITITFRISISGITNSGKPLNISKTARISSPISETSLTIDTSDIPNGKYELHVESENFSEKRSLTYITKQYSFLLQLSKAIFLPGELVQFRVYAVDSETKAVNPTSSNIISITDANGNEITSFSNVTFNRGKHENSFRLSDKTGLGNWNLQFKCENEIVSKEFEVAEYTLPLIQGSLSVPKIIPFKFARVPITVEISYTFGGIVSGSATVTIRRSRSNQIVLTRTVDITSGFASFDVHIEDDLGVQAGESAFFQASLVFEDSLTGNKVTDTERFRVSPYTYNIYTTADSSIVPGTPFKFTIALKKYDGSPAPSGTTVEVIPQDISTIQSQILMIGADGTISSSVNVPSGTTYLSLLIKSRDSSDNYIGASLIQYISGSYLQIDVLTQTPRLGENVDLKIRTGQTIDFVMVHLVSKGILLKTSKVYFSSDNNEDDDPNTVVYSFKPSFKYAPVTQVMVYYIKENKDFVTAQAYIQLDKDLPNYLTISPATQEVKPADRIDLDIESYIGSRVSLVAMDQRSLLLKGGSNIIKEDIFADLYQYGWSNVQYNWNYIADYEYGFGSTGLFVFTNIPRPKTTDNKGKPVQRPERPNRESSDKSDAPEKSGGNVNIRKDFREVFLWREVPIYGSASEFYGCSSGIDDEWKGLETISVKVPESITTYLIYGVSMSKYDGIGLTDNIPSVTIFLPFFLSVELPYSVKRDEVLEQDIIIFNYLKRRQTVEVRIKKNAGFTHQIARCGWKDINGFYALNVTTKVGENIKLNFPLTPKKLGLIPFEVTAKGPLAGDGIKKQLRVIPEGIPRSITSSVFLALDKKTTTISTKLSCKLPDSAYQDTTEISATVAGDIFGKALKNLNKLIRLPSGCVEQTMLSLAPNIAIYMYLLSSGMLTPTLQIILENYISAGYQNMVGYQQTDGSFLASTWLTAYIVQYFYFASTIVFIDPNTIKKGADFVKGRQVIDVGSINFGSFDGPGSYNNLQGRSGLTAYCAIMFTNILSQTTSDYSEYTNTQKNAITYLENNFSASSSTYELGIIAYALQLAGSSKADEAYDLFFARKTDLGSMMYWDVTSSSGSLDIEVTAYGLLNVIKHGENLNTILKVVKYLVSQSNSFGGYSSSQDTVMAIYALSQFAKTFSLNRKAAISITPDVGNSISATIDSTQAFNLQTFDLNPATRQIKIGAKTSDSGLAIVSLICNFYYDPKLVTPVFNINYKFGFSCTSRITFEVCANLNSKGRTNMAIMIVNMPSGFTYNEWQDQTNPNVSITEVTNQKSTVTFYFNSITHKKNCVNINAYRSKFVADLKPATIEVYDYYDTSKYGMIYYEVPDLSSSCSKRYYR